MPRAAELVGGRGQGLDSGQSASDPVGGLPDVGKTAGRGFNISFLNWRTKIAIQSMKKKVRFTISFGKTKTSFDRSSRSLKDGSR